MYRNLTATLIASVLIAACGADDAEDGEQAVAADSATLSGTVVLSENIGLTPDSKLEVVLQDVSLADAPARVIARKEIDYPGQSPIPFTLEYDASQIDERFSYGVSAKVFDRGHLIFISDTFHPAITRGAPTEVRIDAVRIARSKLEIPDAPFAGTRWVLRSVDGMKVEPDPERQEVFMVASSDEQLSGFAGCNNFSGGYTLSADTIDIGNMAVTMMMCEDGADIERHFLKALGNIDTIRISGGTMLAYGEGVVVASFAAGD